MDFLSKFGAKSKIKYSALLAGFLAIVLTSAVVLAVAFLTTAADPTQHIKYKRGTA